ncbi:hypothetical protein ACQ4PT_029615 [Festuca glaucescens]
MACRWRQEHGRQGGSAGVFGGLAAVVGVRAALRPERRRQVLELVLAWRWRGRDPCFWHDVRSYAQREREGHVSTSHCVSRLQPHSLTPVFPPFSHPLSPILEGTFFPFSPCTAAAAAEDGGWGPGTCHCLACTGSSTAKVTHTLPAPIDLPALGLLPPPRRLVASCFADRDRWPPEARFLVAAHHGDVRKIKKIAKELDVQGRGIPATVASTTYMGMNALHAAGCRGRLPAYRYLVEEVGMDVDKPDTAQAFTPAAHAVTNGCLPAIKYLVNHGTDVRQQRSKGNITLLHTAALLGYSEIVEFLLSRGADVDAISDLGTPLAVAALRGYASIVKILLQNNADASCQFGPLTLALQKSSVSCMKLLIQGGTNVSCDNPLDNPLVKAAEKGLTEAIKCLLEAGANPNVHDTLGRLPIELAAEYGTREDVEILFPFTSPISTVEKWSVDGIISHVKMEIKQLEDGNFVKKRMSDLKRQADEAFKKQDYPNASLLYTQALRMDNFDTKLLSNRSLCWLRMGDGQRAFDDAAKCKRLRPKWAKAHYRQGAALMFTKEYDGAYSALSRALELDPESEEIEKLFWEAMELR